MAVLLSRLSAWEEDVITHPTVATPSVARVPPGCVQVSVWLPAPVPVDPVKYALFPPTGPTASKVTVCAALIVYTDVSTPPPVTPLQPMAFSVVVTVILKAPV